MTPYARPARHLINSRQTYTAADIDAAISQRAPSTPPPVWEQPRGWAGWAFSVGFLLLVGLTWWVAWPSFSPRPTPQPQLHLEDFLPAEEQAKLSTLVPLVQGNWFQGYRETPQTCRVMLTDQFDIVTTLDTDLVLRYGPRHASPALCPQGTLILADPLTQNLLASIGTANELMRMLQRPR